MIIDNVKTDLSDAAQEKVKTLVEQAVEKKLHKEMKKFTRKLTFKILLTGAAVAGTVLLVNNADKIVELLTKKTEN